MELDDHLFDLKQTPALRIEHQQVGSDRGGRLGNARDVLAGDGPMRTEREELIARRALVDCVYLVGYCSQIPAILRKCHVGLLVSRSEGHPGCVMEYMAAGLPVVTWAMPGISEVVADREAGFVLKDATPEAIAGTLVQLCQSPELRKKMGQAGRCSVADGRFCPNSYTLRVLDMLTEVVAGQA